MVVGDDGGGHPATGQGFAALGLALKMVEAPLPPHFRSVPSRGLAVRPVASGHSRELTLLSAALGSERQLPRPVKASPELGSETPWLGSGIADAVLGQGRIGAGRRDVSMRAPNLRRTPRAVSEHDAPIVVNADDFNVMRSAATTTNGGAIVLDMPKEPTANPRESSFDGRDKCSLPIYGGQTGTPPLARRQQLQAKSTILVFSSWVRCCQRSTTFGDRNQRSDPFHI
jgi:hypothetical protein